MGKTIGSARARWSEHIRTAKRGSRYALHNAVRKYSPTAFDVAELCYAENHGQLYALEQAIIAAFRAAGVPLYNCTDGGPGVYGYKHSVESHAKMRSMRKEYIKQHPHCMDKSPETRRRIAAALMGHKCSLETRRKQAAAKRGRKRHTNSSQTLLRVVAE